MKEEHEKDKTLATSIKFGFSQLMSLFSAEVNTDIESNKSEKIEYLHDDVTRTIEVSKKLVDQPQIKNIADFNINDTNSIFYFKETLKVKRFINRDTGESMVELSNINNNHIAYKGLTSMANWQTSSTLNMIFAYGLLDASGFIVPISNMQKGDAIDINVQFIIICPSTFIQ